MVRHWNLVSSKLLLTALDKAPWLWSVTNKAETILSLFTPVFVGFALLPPPGVPAGLETRVVLGGPVPGEGRGGQAASELDQRGPGPQ